MHLTCNLRQLREAMMTVAEHREEYWNALLAVTGGRDEAVAVLESLRGEAEAS